MESDYWSIGLIIFGHAFRAVCSVFPLVLQLSWIDSRLLLLLPFLQSDIQSQSGEAGSDSRPVPEFVPAGQSGDQGYSETFRSATILGSSANGSLITLQGLQCHMKI